MAVNNSKGLALRVFCVSKGPETHLKAMADRFNQGRVWVMHEEFLKVVNTDRGDNSEEIWVVRNGRSNVRVLEISRRNPGDRLCTFCVCSRGCLPNVMLTESET